MLPRLPDRGHQDPRAGLDLVEAAGGDVLVIEERADEAERQRKAIAQWCK
jgi:hypothetical protein